MLPDPIERMNARIDDLCFEQFAGVPDGQVRCIECKQLVPISEAHTASPNPDAPLVCVNCLGFDPFDLIADMP
jgi:hypothetical protein